MEDILDISSSNLIAFAFLALILKLTAIVLVVYFIYKIFSKYFDYKRQKDEDL